MARKKKYVSIENIDEFLDVIALENQVSKQEVMLEMFYAWNTLRSIFNDCSDVLKDEDMKDNINFYTRKITDYYF